MATAEDGGSQNIIDLSGISDAELIKALIDFVCDEKDFSGEKRSAMDQMKKLAVECGLLRKETL